MKHLLIFCAFILMMISSQAEVISAADHGFHVHTVIVIDGASPDEVYDAMTRGISHWWDASHSYSLDSSNFYMEARANGCFCELLPNGGSVMHMQVAFADPGKTLRLLGGLGPLQGMGVHGAMTFSLKETETGTELSMDYIVSGYAKDGLAGIAAPVDQVLAGQVGRLKAFMEAKR